MTTSTYGWQSMSWFSSANHLYLVYLPVVYVVMVIITISHYQLFPKNFVKHNYYVYTHSDTNHITLARLCTWDQYWNASTSLQLLRSWWISSFSFSHTKYLHTSYIFVWITDCLVKDSFHFIYVSFLSALQALPFILALEHSFF